MWIDSSFAIEWLLETDRAKQAEISDTPLAILPMQYMETFSFFLKKLVDPMQIIRELSPLEMTHPEKIHIQRGSFLYLEARRQKSKASLADALLAAVVAERRECLLSFDEDFSFLGLKGKNGLWNI